MALLPKQFIRPFGRLRRELFPGDDLNRLVQAWIEDATAKTNGLVVDDEEAAQKAWVYHLAYSDIADRITLNPAQIDVEGEGSTQMLVSQMEKASDLAEKYRAEFDDLTGEDGSAGVNAPRSTTTMSKTRWL